MKKICGIYFYRDLKNDEIVYVGQSTNIYQRHQQHYYKSAYNNQPINRVLQNNKLRYILEIERRCLPEELNELEQEYIDLLQPRFNFTKGGHFISMSEDIIDKIRLVNVKYTLWDAGYCRYEKNKMYQHNRKPNPCKCFQLVYNNHMIPIGLFGDFVSCDVIYTIIEEENNEVK